MTALPFPFFLAGCGGAPPPKSAPVLVDSRPRGLRGQVLRGHRVPHHCADCGQPGKACGGTGIHGKERIKLKNAQFWASLTPEQREERRRVAREQYADKRGKK